MDVADEPGELDGEGGPEVGVDGSGTVCDRHGLRVGAGSSRYLRAERCRGGQEAVSKLVRLGACDAGANRRTARADGPSCPDSRGAIGGNLGALDSGPDDRLHGRTQQPVLSHEAQGSRVPDSGVHDGYVLLRRWEAHNSILLTH